MAQKPSSQSQATLSQMGRSIPSGRSYYFAWAGLAAVAMLYISSHLFVDAPQQAKPEPAQSAETTSFEAADQPKQLIKQASSAQARRIAQYAQKHAWSLANDIAKVKQSMRELDTRMSFLEKQQTLIIKNIQEKPSRPALITGSLPKATPSTSQWKASANRIEKAQKKAKTRSVLPSVTVKYSALPKTGFNDTNSSSPELKVSKLSNATRTQFGIHVSSGKTVGELKLKWENLSKRHGETLSLLKGRYIIEPGQALNPFQLILGPFTNASAAIQICARLHLEKAFCKQTVFIGKKL